jgi:thiazole synthase
MTVEGAPNAVVYDMWEVAGRRFRSRLIIGTGRYKDLEETGRIASAVYARRALSHRVTSIG